MKATGISKYKLVRFATEALRNSLRLHFDAIVLYENSSYPSAFQLSILSLEEFAKAKWIETYIWESETNEGYLDEESESEWLNLLYSHPEKQWSYIARELFDFSPRLAKLIKSGKLEQKKQNSIYVGFSRAKGKVDTEGRLSTPLRTKSTDAKQYISLINSEFLTICKRIEDDEFYFSVKGMDQIFDYQIYSKLLQWPYASPLKSMKWRKDWHKKKVPNQK